MKNSHNIYLISDSTGETLDRIFLALKAQFENFDYKINQFSFTRTETQIKKIIENAHKNKNPISENEAINKLQMLIQKGQSAKDATQKISEETGYSKNWLYSQLHKKLDK